MSVLVIGSGGYMGSHLMDALNAQGMNAIGASSSNGYGIDPVSGILPENFLISPHTSTVVYMAQSPRFRQVPEESAHVLAVNVYSATRAAILARAAGVKRFIYISTGTVYAPSFLPIKEGAPVRRDGWYALSKLQGEEALNLFRQDMEVVIVRPFGVYGPRQEGRLVGNLLNSVLKGLPITLQGRLDDPNDKDGLKISLCYIEDATRALLEIICNGGDSIINLAGMEAYSVRTIANKLGLLVDRNPKFEFSKSVRDSDLIADVSILRKYAPFNFTKIDEGLSKLLTKN